MLGVLGRRERPSLTSRELARRLSVRPGASKALRDVLVSLLEQGRIERVGEAYRMLRGDGLVEGVFRPAASAPEPGAAATSAAGVVIDANGRAFSVESSCDASPGDRVLAAPFGDPSRPRVEIIEVLEGARSHWIGIVERRRGGYELRPYRDELDWRLPISARDLAGARVGEVVEAVPAERRRRGAVAGMRVRERLGVPGDPEADFRAVAWRRRLPLAFSEAALDEARRAPAEITASELRQRLDLRDRPFVTIDPASARDHDDAVHVDDAETGATRLWVAIADVSHYVRPGSALDRAAFERGNSVYFPDRALPMLPERLSSELCSLRPDEDRLVLAVELPIEADGSVGRAGFHEAVIRSRARISYAQAADVMTAEPASAQALAAVTAQPEAIAEQLRALARIGRTLTSRRLAAGALDFELPEAEIVLAPDGRVSDIVRAPRSIAHRAIEEAMLAANRAVARTLVQAERPSLHRVHEPPAVPALAELRELYASFGLLRAGAGEISVAEIKHALTRVAGRPAERLIHMATLRAMRQARYCEDSLGHFALAFDAYLHFTSPIRRYADLVVHRALKQLIREPGAQGRPRDAAAGRERMQRIALRTSARERIAMAAEREVRDLAKCAFMRAHVGRELTGVITGVAEHGLYVTLDDFFVEGMVPVSALPGYYEFDRKQHALVARTSGASHSLGDALRVRVDSVDQIKAWINFSIVDRRSPRVDRAGPPVPPARPKRAPSRRRDRR